MSTVQKRNLRPSRKRVFHVRKGNSFSSGCGLCRTSSTGRVTTLTVHLQLLTVSVTPSLPLCVRVSDLSYPCCGLCRASTGRAGSNDSTHCFDQSQHTRQLQLLNTHGDMRKKGARLIRHMSTHKQKRPKLVSVPTCCAERVLTSYAGALTPVMV